MFYTKVCEITCISQCQLL